jgi:hypothetical protein
MIGMNPTLIFARSKSAMPYALHKRKSAPFDRQSCRPIRTPLSKRQTFVGPRLKFGENPPLGSLRQKQHEACQAAKIARHCRKPLICLRFGRMHWCGLVLRLHRKCPLPGQHGGSPGSYFFSTLA